MLGAATSALGGWLTNKDSQHFAAQQSSTAYQRAVIDAQKAGLNPYLVAQQGGAATVSPSLVNPLGGVSGSVSAYRQYKMDKALNDAQVSKVLAERDLVDKANENQMTVNASTAFEYKKAQELWADTKLAQKRMFQVGVDKVLADINDTNSAIAYRDVQRRLASLEVPKKEMTGGTWQTMLDIARGFTSGWTKREFRPASIDR